MVVWPENKPLVNPEIKPVAEPLASSDLKPIAQPVSDQKDTMTDSYHFADQPSKLTIQPVEDKNVPLTPFPSRSRRSNLFIF